MKVFEHGGNVYGKIDPAADFSRWLDFSANISPLGLSDSIRKSILDNMDNLIHYPDPTGQKLKQAISVYAGVSEKNIVLGNGAVELMYIYMHSRKPAKVLVPVPSFSEYERATLSADAKVEYFYLQEKENFALDVCALDKFLPTADVLILGNPNNPTANLLTVEQIEQITSAAKNSGTDVIVDESFIDFRQDSKKYTAVSLVEKYDNLIILQSMTKFYAIPGLRLGFAVVSEALAEKMEMGKDPWNVNSLAQAAGVAGLQDKAYQELTRKTVAENMYSLSKSLREMTGLKVYEPTVNFILLNTREIGITSGALTAKMREKGVLIRDCSNYPGLDEYYVRVAVKSHEENNRLLEVLKACLISENNQ